MRITILPLTVAMVAGLSTGSLAQVDEARDSDQRQPVLARGNAQAPQALRVSAECSDVKRGSGLAEFTWSTPSGEAQAQRVDVTMFRDGFQTNRFDTLGRIPAAQSRLVWDGGRAGVNYYWRVMILTPQGWVPSETARYEAPICPVDFVEPPKEPPQQPPRPPR
jgi:hypothetical protein